MNVLMLRVDKTEDWENRDNIIIKTSKICKNVSAWGYQYSSRRLTRLCRIWTSEDR